MAKVQQETQCKVCNKFSDQGIIRILIKAIGHHPNSYQGNRASSKFLGNSLIELTIKKGDSDLENILSKPSSSAHSFSLSSLWIFRIKIQDSRR